MPDDPYFDGQTAQIRCAQCGHAVDATDEKKEEHRKWHADMAKPPEPADVEV